MKFALLSVMLFGFFGYQDHQVKFQDHQVKWSQDYARSLDAARSLHLPMLVLIENSESDAETLSLITDDVTPDEASLLRRYQLCRIDVSSDLGRKVANVFGPSSYPYTVITDSSCRRIVCRRAGQLSEEDWLNTLRRHTGQSLDTEYAAPSTNADQSLFSHSRLVDAEQAAQENHRPVLVFVTMDGCHYCDKMKAETLTDSGVRKSVGQGFESVVTNSSDDTEVVHRFGVNIFPTTLILSPEGNLVDKIDGFVAPQEFQRRLASAGHSGT